MRASLIAMDWRDEGVLVAVRPHGESAAIIEVFTALHGRHAGVVRGGAGRRMAPVLQLGAQLDLIWRARLEDHLGSFKVEPVFARAAGILGDRLALLGLGSICALCSFSLPERAAHPQLYAATCALLDRLGQDGWLLDYVHWELTLLEESGFGLDLGQCAVTGARSGLAYVSPRTGRAVTADAAGNWADRLLPLPAALSTGTALSHDDLRTALAMTGYFLQNWLAPAVGNRPLPEARARLVDALA